MFKKGFNGVLCGRFLVMHNQHNSCESIFLYFCTCHAKVTYFTCFTWTSQRIKSDVGLMKSEKGPLSLDHFHPRVQLSGVSVWAEHQPKVTPYRDLLDLLT